MRNNNPSAIINHSVVNSNMRLFTIINCIETPFESVEEIVGFAERLFDAFNIKPTSVSYAWKHGEKDKSGSCAYRNINKLLSEATFDELLFVNFFSEIRGIKPPEKLVGELCVESLGSHLARINFMLRKNEGDTLPDFTADVLNTLGKKPLVRYMISDELECRKQPNSFAIGICNNFLSPFECRIARTLNYAQFFAENKLPFLFKYSLLNKDYYQFAHSFAKELDGFTELDFSALRGSDMESYENDPTWSELYDKLLKEGIMIPLEAPIWSDFHGG